MAFKPKGMVRSERIGTRLDRTQQIEETMNGEGILLALFADERGMRVDWHEPDEQNVTAKVVGRKFDNAGVAGEMLIQLRHGTTVTELNLASVLALATHAARDHFRETHIAH